MAQKKKIVIVHQAYPPIPKGAEPEEIVEEHYTYRDETGYPKRVLVGSVYCPKKDVTNPNELFDPTTPAARAALEKYKDRFANRKRYDRDIKRRRRA